MGRNGDVKSRDYVTKTCEFKCLGDMILKLHHLIQDNGSVTNY